MSKVAAVNASPLIFLSRGGLIDLLKLASNDIVVTSHVFEELRRRGPEDVTVQTIEREHWIRVVETPVIPQIIQAWDLGEGEASVPAWALTTPGAVAILDDLAARRCAASLGLPVRGTLGLVLLAKKQDKVTQARPLLVKLRQSGMYLSDDILNKGPQVGWRISQ